MVCGSGFVWLDGWRQVHSGEGWVERLKSNMSHRGPDVSEILFVCLRLTAVGKLHGHDQPRQ